MKHAIISFLAVILVAVSASGKDRLYIDNFNIAPGETMQVPVILLNDTAYSGFQTDLYLPDGLSLDTEYDEYIIDLTSRRDNSHTVTANLLSNGAIRIYVSSLSARPFSGYSGAIMTLSITADNSFSGTAIVELKNSICAEPIGTRHVLKDEACIVNPGKAGDVNIDGEVNIADVNAIIRMILASNMSIFGDVNCDGEVNIADVNAVIRIILNS